MNFVNECGICHAEHEIKDMEYDPILGWICTGCEAAPSIEVRS